MADLENWFTSLSLDSPAGDGKDNAQSAKLQRVVADVKSGRIKNVVVMCGAGISVNAGIPDFRTPGTGLYDNLQRFNLDSPEDIFTLSFFRRNPHPFIQLAKELMPGNFRPTRAHCFIKLLHERGLLLRCYSQNIDSLEAAAGLPAEALIAAHGNFDSASCISCQAACETERVREDILAGRTTSCATCQGLVKPDIVFFGESLPDRFFQGVQDDFPQCDLLLVMGTSLQVAPFSHLISLTPTSTSSKWAESATPAAQDSPPPRPPRLPPRHGGARRAPRPHQPGAGGP